MRSRQSSQARGRATQAIKAPEVPEGSRPLGDFFAKEAASAADKRTGLLVFIRPDSDAHAASTDLCEKGSPDESIESGHKMNMASGRRGLASRDCPICGSTGKDFIYRQLFDAASGCALMEGYDVVVCRQCGLGFADGIPPQREFDAYYESMSKYEGRSGSDADNPSIRERIDAAAEFIARATANRDARILDVGCSTGDLLVALKRRDFSNLVGLDPSPVCARAVAEREGLVGRQGFLGDLPGWGESFDVVCMAQVLEHVRDLRAALTQVRAVIHPRGALFVEVPNVQGFASCFDGPFQQFSTEHINYFSGSSLANLLRIAGFSASSMSFLGTSAGVMIRMIAARVEGDEPRLEQDFGTRSALAEYVEKSRQVDTAVLVEIESLASSGRPIIVWGTGTHTLRLLRTSALGRANVVGFIDSNPHYQGRTVAGVPVASPQWLQGRSEPVLVSSWVYQQDIVRQIRHELGCSNDLICLYDR